MELEKIIRNIRISILGGDELDKNTYKMYLALKNFFDNLNIEKLPDEKGFIYKSKIANETLIKTLSYKRHIAFKINRKFMDNFSMLTPTNRHKLILWYYNNIFHRGLDTQPEHIFFVPKL